MADRVLQKAEQFREEIALTWLGKKLGVGREFTHISIKLCEKEDRVATMLCGPGRRWPGDHQIWLHTTRELALGASLAHEVTHVVLNARFPQGMPAWANEGIASRYDDEECQHIRQRILSVYVSSNRWPAVSAVLAAEVLNPNDQASYAIAESLISLLVGRQDCSTFLLFVEHGQQHGWDQALQRFYQIPSVDHLQQYWQQWVKQTVRN